MFGLDVGTASPGLAFVDADTFVIQKLIKFDMTVDNDLKMDIKATNAGPMVVKWMRKFKPYFDRCVAGGVEIQPPIGVGIMKRVQDHMETSIRCLYPHVDVYLTDPKDVRRWLGTGVKKGSLTNEEVYKKRKSKGALAPVISAHDRTRMQKLFTKDTFNKRTKKWSLKPKIDDVTDAAQIALYVITHRAELARKAAMVDGTPTTTPNQYLMENVQMYPPPKVEKEEAEEGVKRKRKAEPGIRKKRKT